MLAPRKIKHRKQHKGRMKGTANRGDSVCFGHFGLKAMECGWISSRQIEAVRIAISRKVRKHGKMWIRIFPDKPITKKPAETRMGKGKGTVEVWVAPVRRGKMLFEIEGVPENEALEVLKNVSNKLPVKTKIVKREEYRASKI